MLVEAEILCILSSLYRKVPLAHAGAVTPRVPQVPVLRAGGERRGSAQRQIRGQAVRTAPSSGYRWS